LVDEATVSLSSGGVKRDRVDQADWSYSRGVLSGVVQHITVTEGRRGRWQPALDYTHAGAETPPHEMGMRNNWVGSFCDSVLPRSGGGVGSRSPLDSADLAALQNTQWCRSPRATQGDTDGSGARADIRRSRRPCRLLRSPLGPRLCARRGAAATPGPAAAQRVGRQPGYFPGDDPVRSGADCPTQKMAVLRVVSACA